MQATIRLLSMAGALSIAGCSKPVDPAYLAEIEGGAESICKCVTVPAEQRMDCRRATTSVHPKAGPGGEAPGIYEEGLDEASKHKIDTLRAMASSCEAELMKD